MSRLEIQLAGAYEVVKFPLKRIFHVGVPGRRFGRLGPKVANGIRSSQRQRNQVVNLVVARFVFRNPVLGIRLPFEPRRHRPHLLRVAGNADVLSGHVECVTRCQLRIGKNRRGLLGEEGLSEKEKGEAQV